MKTFNRWIENKKMTKEQAINSYCSWKGHMKRGNSYTVWKRMKDKANLKKFVIVFEGFEKYYIEELK